MNLSISLKRQHTVITQNNMI